jgi:hypothetical protein
LLILNVKKNPLTLYEGERVLYIEMFTSEQPTCRC